MQCSDVLNLIAIVLVPIIAVIVGRWMQERSEKHKDKMDVFKAVMTFRYGWSKAAVEALNSIPIVFSDEKKDANVRQKWKTYYEHLCIQNPDAMQLQKRNEALYILLESMAKNLGYKDVITWEDIQHPYIPVAMANAMNNEMIIQNSMANLVQIMEINNQLQGSMNNADSESNQKEESIEDTKNN